MASRKWQNPFRRKALRPIPRVVDNTDLLAIKQHAIDESHHPVRKGAKRGTFSPTSNKKFI
jgi:hypothetical protein